MTPPFYRSSAAVTRRWSGALAFLMLVAPPAARAQGRYARGDATCDLRRTAADVVATVRGLGGDSVCGNDDCDRDTAAAAADVDCAAGCLFGACPVPAHAPQVTAVAPDSAPAIAPLSRIIIQGGNFGPPERPKRVLIGGFPAPLAELLDDGSLEVVVPIEVPPGPTTLVVADGELAGAPIPITIAPAEPIGPLDTLDSVLDLADDALAALLELDLEGAYEGDAATLRARAEAARAELAAQRAVLATDPDLNPALRAAIDQALDAAGAAELLRASIAETEAVAQQSGARAPGTFAPTLRVVGAAGRTLRVAGATIRAAAVAAGAVSAATGVAISTPVLVGIAVVSGVLGAAGGYFLGQRSRRNESTPQLIDIEYRDGNRVRRSFPTVGGTAEVVAADTFPSTELLFSTSFGVFAAPFVSQQGDDTFTYQVPNQVGLCGKVTVYLLGPGGLDSNTVSTHLQPLLLDAGPSRVYQKQLLDLELDGVDACDARVTFAKTGQFAEQPVEDRGSPAAIVPGLPAGPDYRVHATVDGVPSQEERTVEIVAPPTAALQCARTRLNEPPGVPSSTVCNVTVTGTRLPGLDFSWRSSTPAVATVENVDAEETTVRAVGNGMTQIVAMLGVEPEVIAESNAVTVTVSGRPPALNVSCAATALLARPGMPSTTTCSLRVTPAEAPIPAGSRIAWLTDDPLVATVSDVNARTTTVTAGVIGSTMLRARLVAGAEVLAESNAVRLTVDDQTAPTVTLTTMSPAMVRAGGSIEVRARADDNVQVNRLRLDTTGDAVAGVSPSAEVPCPLEARCSVTFTVNLKQSDFLNALVGVRAEGFDGRGNMGVSNVLNFQISDDAECPQVVIQSPQSGARVRAGDTVQVSVRVSDNRPGDSGVRRVLVDATGPAVAAAPMPMEVTLPQALPDATRLVTFRVADDLGPIADRTITITANAADDAGNLCAQPQTVAITAGGAPEISAVSPNPVNAGATITITGQAFGAAQGSSSVLIGGAAAAVSSWSNTTIAAQVPAMLSGDVQVSVVVDGQSSNAVPLQVLGTGDVQVTLIWSDTNDLDLHLIEPGGEEIFFANRTSTAGGRLDVDANAGCGGTTTAPRENIFYPAGSAPTGRYEVRVVHFQVCSEMIQSSGITVTARVDGRFMTLISNGSLGPGGTLTATFTR